MERDKIYRSAILWIVIFLILSLSGCRTTGSIVVGNHFPGPGPVYNEAPPPWAPAHGNRAKYHYRYYPHHNVYFDGVRGVYFYLYGGAWRMSATLPATIRITVNEFVTLDMDDDRPYRYHDDVVKRYPPGQIKKGNQERDNSQDRNPGRSQGSDRGGSRDYKQETYKDSGDKKSQDKSQAKLRESDRGKAQEKAKATPQGYTNTKSQVQDKNKTSDTGTIKAPDKDRESQDTSNKKSRDKDRDKDDDKNDNKDIIPKGVVDRVSLISR